MNLVDKPQIIVKDELIIPEYNGKLKDLYKGIKNQLSNSANYLIPSKDRFVDFLKTYLKLKYIHEVKLVKIPANTFTRLVLGNSVLDQQIVDFAQKNLNVNSVIIDPVTLLWNFYYLTSSDFKNSEFILSMEEVSPHNVIGYCRNPYIPECMLFPRPVLSIEYYKYDQKWGGHLYHFNDDTRGPHHVEGEVIFIPKEYKEPSFSELIH